MIKVILYRAGMFSVPLVEKTLPRHVGPPNPLDPKSLRFTNFRGAASPPSPPPLFTRPHPRFRNTWHVFEILDTPLKRKAGQIRIERNWTDWNWTDWNQTDRNQTDRNQTDQNWPARPDQTGPEASHQGSRIMAHGACFGMNGHPRRYPDVI